MKIQYKIIAESCHVINSGKIDILLSIINNNQSIHRCSLLSIHLLQYLNPTNDANTQYTPLNRSPIDFFDP
jgi:hypothetical protein